MALLCQDVLIKIVEFAFSDTKDLARLARTCKLWNKHLMSAEVAWKAIAKRKYPAMSEKMKIKNYVNYILKRYRNNCITL